MFICKLIIQSEEKKGFRIARELMEGYDEYAWVLNMKWWMIK